VRLRYSSYFIECVVIDHVLGLRNDYQAKLFRTIADIVLHDVINKIKNKECPYCGRKLSTKSALRVHLRKSDCRNHLYEDVRYVIDVVSKMKVHIKKSDNKVIFNGLKFKNYTKLSEYLKQHPEVLRL